MAGWAPEAGARVGEGFGFEGGACRDSVFEGFGVDISGWGLKASGLGLGR